MVERYSERYAIDPELRGWGGEAYAKLYPDEFLKPVFDAIGLPEAAHAEAKKRVLSAAFQYENHKTTVLELQSTPAKERSQRVRLAKKGLAFLEEYNKLNDRSFSLMVAAARSVDASIPNEVAFPSVASIGLVAKIAALAATVKSPVVPHFAPSHTHYIWLMDVARIFEGSPMNLSVGSFYTKGESSSLDVLHTLMEPLDPMVTKDQLAEALKAFVKNTGRSKIRKKASKGV